MGLHGTPEGIYRAMEEENGLPMLGGTATTLGIRKGKDIIPDSANLVQGPNFTPGRPNGLSCAPTIHDLPAFARPVQWGGLNKKTTLWKIDVADLPIDLLAVEDTIPGRRRHVSIGPSQTMNYDRYTQAILATRSKWKVVIPPGP